MNFEEKDRILFRKFFGEQQKFMEEKSLLNPSNLEEFKKRFLSFIDSNKCKENKSCKVFLDVLDKEIEGVTKQIKGIVLKPVSMLQTDNKIILLWVDEANVAFSVPYYEIRSLNANIEKKFKQNKQESIASIIDAQDKIVK